MSKNSFDPTVGGERIYSGVSKVINDFDPLDDAYQNDFPQAYIESPTDATNAPAVSPGMYDAVITAKYGKEAAQRAQAVRGIPAELPVFEDVQSKAPAVELDEIQAEDVPASERSRLMLLKMRERYAEETKSTTADGRLDFNDERCVKGLSDSTLYRHPGTQESITGAELKRKFKETQELMHQMQVLKEGARIRAEQARAEAEPTMPLDNFRSRQVLGAVSDTSPEGKAFLVEQLGAVTQEDLLEVKQDISEIKEMLKQLTTQSHLGNSQVTTTDEEVSDASDT